MSGADKCQVSRHSSSGLNSKPTTGCPLRLVINSFYSYCGSKTRVCSALNSLKTIEMVFFLIHTFKKVLKKLNSRKIGKIRERIALEIFLPIFREFCIFNTFLKVYIKNCTFVLCLLHSEMSKTVFSKLLKKLNY